MRELLERIYPLHRTLASDGTERALEILSEYLPPSYRILGFNPGERAWTWTVPPKYVVRTARLTSKLRAGTHGSFLTVHADFAENPLHLVSYSKSVDVVVNWKELYPHLHKSYERQSAIPWRYSYYRDDWGFCLSHLAIMGLERDEKYAVHIDADFDMTPGAFKVGECVINPGSASELVVLTHIDHPNQANDDAAGVAVAVEVARRLAQHPLPAGSMAVRFLFVPETIGTIVYLSHNEYLIQHMRGGIFIEMPGAGQTIALQHTLKGNDLLDRIALLAPHVDRESGFAELAANDERVLSAPNVNIPCISFTRAPYPEYHTSDDNLSIIDYGKMDEMANAVEYTVRMYASNYVPCPLFRGPVMLSRFGLFVDWQQDWNRNRLVEAVMMAMDGSASVFEIAERTGADYWDVRKICELFVQKGLVARG